MGNVYALHPPQHPIRHFVRIGHTGYRTLENLLTAGRAPIRHAVSNRIDAVLSPAHLLDHSDLRWLFVDLRAVHNLRKALDRAGG